MFDGPGQGDCADASVPVPPALSASRILTQMFRTREHENSVGYRSQTPDGVCFVVAICNCAGSLDDNAWPVSRDFQNKIEAVEVKSCCRGVAETSHLVEYRLPEYNPATGNAEFYILRQIVAIFQNLYWERCLRAGGDGLPVLKIGHCSNDQRR